PESKSKTPDCALSPELFRAPEFLLANRSARAPARAGTKRLPQVKILERPRCRKEISIRSADLNSLPADNQPPFRRESPDKKLPGCARASLPEINRPRRWERWSQTSPPRFQPGCGEPATPRK